MKLKQPQTLTCCQLAENQARKSERERAKELLFDLIDSIGFILQGEINPKIILKCRKEYKRVEKELLWGKEE